MMELVVECNGNEGNCDCTEFLVDGNRDKHGVSHMERKCTCSHEKVCHQVVKIELLEFQNLGKFAVIRLNDEAPIGLFGVYDSKVQADNFRNNYNLMSRNERGAVEMHPILPSTSLREFATPFKYVYYCNKGYQCRTNNTGNRKNVYIGTFADMVEAVVIKTAIDCELIQLDVVKNLIAANNANAAPKKELSAILVHNVSVSRLGSDLTILEIKLVDKFIIICNGDIDSSVLISNTASSSSSSASASAPTGDSSNIEANNSDQMYVISIHHSREQADSQVKILVQMSDTELGSVNMYPIVTWTSLDQNATKFKYVRKRRVSDNKYSCFTNERVYIGVFADMVEAAAIKTAIDCELIQLDVVKNALAANGPDNFAKELGNGVYKNLKNMCLMTTDPSTNDILSVYSGLNHEDIFPQIPIMYPASSHNSAETLTASCLNQFQQLCMNLTMNILYPEISEEFCMFSLLRQGLPYFPHSHTVVSLVKELKLKPMHHSVVKKYKDADNISKVNKGITKLWLPQAIKIPEDGDGSMRKKVLENAYCWTDVKDVVPKYIQPTDSDNNSGELSLNRKWNSSVEITLAKNLTTLTGYGNMDSLTPLTGAIRSALEIAANSTDSKDIDNKSFIKNGVNTTAMAAGKWRAVVYDKNTCHCFTLRRNDAVPALVTLESGLLKELLLIPNSVEIMNGSIYIPSLHITEVAYSFINRIINDPVHYARNSVHLKTRVYNNTKMNKLGKQGTSEDEIHRNQVQAMKRSYTFCAIAVYVWCRDHIQENQFFKTSDKNIIQVSVKGLVDNINFKSFLNEMFSTSWMSTECVAYGLLMSHVDGGSCNEKLIGYKKEYLNHDIHGESRIRTRIKNIKKGEGTDVSDTLIVQQMRFIEFLLTHLTFAFVSYHSEKLLGYANDKGTGCEKFRKLMTSSLTSQRLTIDETNIESSIESVVQKIGTKGIISPVLVTFANLSKFNVPKETEEMKATLNKFIENGNQKKRNVNQECEHESHENDPNGAENNDDEEDEEDEEDDKGEGYAKMEL